MICHILMDYWEFCSQKIKISDFLSRRGVKWPQNVGVLIFFCRLFFLSAWDPILWENHSGIKSPGGGRGGTGSPQTNIYVYLETSHIYLLTQMLFSTFSGTRFQTNLKKIRQIQTNFGRYNVFLKMFLTFYQNVSEKFHFLLKIFLIFF